MEKALNTMNEHLFGPLQGGDAIGEYASKFRHSDSLPLEISAPLDLFPSLPRPSGIMPQCSWVDSWPFHDRAGVYMIYSEAGELMYIGKTSMNQCIGKRLYVRFGGDESCVIKDDWWPQPPRFVVIVAVPDTQRFEAPALEEFLIKRLQPICNVAGK